MGASRSWRYEPARARVPRAQRSQLLPAAQSSRPAAINLQTGRGQGTGATATRQDKTDRLCDSRPNRQIAIVASPMARRAASASPPSFLQPATYVRVQNSQSSSFQLLDGDRHAAASPSLSPSPSLHLIAIPLILPRRPLLYTHLTFYASNLHADLRARAHTHAHARTVRELVSHPPIARLSLARSRSHGRCAWTCMQTLTTSLGDLSILRSLILAPIP